MAANKVPLNQIYQQKKTFEDHPKVLKTFEELNQLSIDNRFCVYDEHGEVVRIKGRRYDDAVLYNSDVDFTNKLVCDLGARDGIFGSYLTKDVAKIHVSDYFEEWEKGIEHDLGQIDEWTKIWKDAAYHPERLVVEHQDITKLTYPDNMFDIVVSTSVIEHLYNQGDWDGDMTAMKEMVRVCKPGGVILLSTDMALESKWVSGTFYYSKEDLYKQLIDHSGCKVRGDITFDMNHPDNDAMTTHNGFGPVSSVVFSLEKPM